jgi:sigma-B regulation protein RsbU (phosphoserine phosphatase)
MKDPVQLISSLNKTLFQNIQKNMFISFVFTVIDTENRQMELINCGHPPALHYHHSADKLSEYRTGDLALGLSQQSTFEKVSISYNSGDLIVLFSDGLVETINDKGEEFGLENLRRKLKNSINMSAEEIYKSVLKETEQFRGIIPQRDDISLLVLKIF